MSSCKEWSSGTGCSPGSRAREDSDRKHPAGEGQKHRLGAALGWKLMQSWAAKCANRWLMWLSYSQLSQPASKRTWTGLVQFSATENQTDLAMQLQSCSEQPKFPKNSLRDPKCVEQPVSSLCLNLQKVKGGIKKWVLFLQPSHTQHPLFPQRSSAFAVKGENKEFFFPCSSVRGKREANMVSSTSDSQPNWAVAVMPTKSSAGALLSQTFPSPKCWRDTRQFSHINWSGTSWLEASACAKTVWLEGMGIEKWIKIWKKIQENLRWITMH